MSWIVTLLAIVKSIMDRLPGRMESLRNERDKLKGQLHDIQLKDSFTMHDSFQYQLIANKLRDVEKRLSNAGG